MTYLTLYSPPAYPSKPKHDHYQEPLQEARKLCWAPGSQPVSELLLLFIALRSTFPGSQQEKAPSREGERLFISWRCQLPGPRAEIVVQQVQRQLGELRELLDELRYSVAALKASGMQLGTRG